MLLVPSQHSITKRDEAAIELDAILKAVVIFMKEEILERRSRGNLDEERKRLVKVISHKLKHFNPSRGSGASN